MRVLVILIEHPTSQPAPQTLRGWVGSSIDKPRFEECTEHPPHIHVGLAQMVCVHKERHALPYLQIRIRFLSRWFWCTFPPPPPSPRQ